MRPARWIALLAALVVALVVAWRMYGSRDARTAEAAKAAESSQSASSQTAQPLRPNPQKSGDAGLTHFDPQKRAEILAELRAMFGRADASVGPPASSGALALGGSRPFRSTNDIALGAKFVHERIREDFAPMAKGCYEDLLRRKAEAEGDVVIGFEIMGDESVGGVVSSAEIRDESTLRDAALETCLRESFLSVYFDPPPAGVVATIRYPFHFAAGDVDTSHEIHLRDRRGETAPAASR